MTLGLFTYQNNRVSTTPQENEIDIEFSTWNNTIYPKNSQYLFQYRQGGNVNNPNLITPTRFRTDLIGDYSTHKFTWTPGNISFQSYHGNYPNLPSAQYLINQKTYSDTRIPNEGNEKVYLNLWLYGATAPSNLQETEVIIKSFTFKKIVPTISVISPNGGENWIIGSTNNITWTSANFTGNVNVEINGNYPSGTWEPIAMNTANDGSQTYTVTGTEGTAKIVRVTSVNKPAITDMSNNNFSFIAPTICTPPSTQATIGAYTNNTTGTTLTVNWTRGNRTGGVIVVGRLKTTANVDPTSGTSYNANPLFGSGSTTGAGNYVVYKGTGSNINLSGLSCTTDYIFTVYVYNSNGTCYKIPGSSSGVTTVACTGSTITINASNTVIPPWQRQNDDYDGKVSVNRSNLNASWHLEINVHDNITGYERAIIYPSTTEATQIFNTAIIVLNANAQLKQYSIEGKIMRYYAVLDNTNPAIVAEVIGSVNTNNGRTNIIERKWDKKNVVYFNNGTEPLRIPVKYDPTYPYNSNLGIIFNRINNVSFTMVPGLSGILLNEPYSILPADIRYTKSFLKIEDGYMVIEPDKYISNLQKVLPGDFEYQIVKHAYSSLYTVLEKGEFDLTKFGKISDDPNSNTSGNLLIMVGGIFNEIESSVEGLRENLNDVTTNPNSDESYSVIEYARMNVNNKKYSSWYIAQGNANYITRNGYDIGLALKKIVSQYEKTSNVNEINILCHSKGGLDTRSMLSGFNSSFKGDNFNLNTTEIYLRDKIKKVLFLGTPHWGADLAKLFSSFPGSVGAVGSIPGVYDLTTNSASLQYLNKSVSYPQNIYFLNLTGYRNYILKSDQVVKVSESQKPALFTNNVVQLYQNDYRFCSTAIPSLIFCWPFFHMEIHKSKTLNYSGYEKLNCINNGNTNLNKVVSFLNDSYPDPLVLNCSSSSIYLYGQAVGSIISGANFYLKPSFDTHYYPLGKTDEYGGIHIELLGGINIGDSIKIEAPGYETLIAGVDSNIILTRKINVSMLKSLNATNKIKYASLKLVNQNPITSNKQISLEATGQNVLSYKINSPLNQDTVFVPLNLINNQFTAQLDTGINRIHVQFIGQQDTVTLTKEVNYLPDSLMKLNTFNVNIIADTASIGAKLYVNNQFVKEIRSRNDTVPLVTGRNTVYFTKFGYVDSLLIVDSAIMLKLALELVPYSYSQTFDSSIVNFPTQGKLQYRINVTMLDSAQKSIISIKQYDGNFPGTGLIPKSRKFEFRRLNTPAWSNIKTAMVLDQIANLSVDSIYLLKISDDTSFTKIFFDSTGAIAGYDSLVQKLNYNYINFKNGTTTKEALVIMKKKAPILKSVSTLSINENSSFSVPLSQLFSDPDSIRNDMTFQIQNANPTGLNLSLSNGNVVIKTGSGYSGSSSFIVNATHDGLLRTNTINVNVISLPPQPTLINGNVNVLLAQTLAYSIPAISGATGYNWQLSGGGILNDREFLSKMVCPEKLFYRIGLWCRDDKYKSI